jgi:DNA-binding transcriptional ArsR family regulator
LLSSDPTGAVFAALADATRRDLLRRLSADGPCTATQLAAGLPCTRQAVSKHLAVLSDAGLVAGARQGRETRYRVTPAPLTEAMSWMATVGADWDRRLVALRDLLS